MNPIEILSIGKKTPKHGRPRVFSAEDMGAIAAAFNLSGTPAPFVPGHPPDDKPAVGNVIRLSAANGKLLATDYTLDPTIEGVIRSGEMNRVSVKLWAPDHPENKTGTYMLRHVGLLGRSQPADEDIAEIKFSNDDTEIIITMSQPDTKTETKAPEVINEPPAKPSPDPAAIEFAKQLEAKNAALEAQQLELSKRLDEINRRELVFSRAERINPFLEQLIQDEQIMPSEKAGFVALFSQAEPQEIELSAGDDTTKTDTHKFLKDFLSRLPKRIDYGDVELSAKSKDPKGMDKDKEKYDEDMAKVRRMYETGKPVER